MAAKGRALYAPSNDVVISVPRLTILMYFKRIDYHLSKYIRCVVLCPVMGEKPSNEKRNFAENLGK